MSQNVLLYLMYLGKIELVVHDYGAERGIIIIGDFHADVNKFYYRERSQLSNALDLVISDVSLLSRDTYARLNNGTLTNSWLEHCTPSLAMHESTTHLSVDNSYHSSDHFPLHVKLKLHVLPRLIDDNATTSNTMIWSFDN